MELAKEIEEQNPWILLTRRLEEKFLIKQKKKVCVKKQTDKAGIFKHFYGSDSVFAKVWEYFEFKIYFL